MPVPATATMAPPAGATGALDVPVPFAANTAVDAPAIRKEPSVRSFALMRAACA